VSPNLKIELNNKVSKKNTKCKTSIVTKEKLDEKKRKICVDKKRNNNETGEAKTTEKWNEFNNQLLNSRKSKVTKITLNKFIQSISVKLFMAS